MKKPAKPEQIKPEKKRLTLPGQKKHATIKEALSDIKGTLEAMHLDALQRLKNK